LGWSLALIAMLASGPAMSPPPERGLAAPILAIHNRERTRVGVPPLAWSERLAGEAAAYAPALVAMGGLEHSDYDTRPGTGENLAMGTRGHYSPADLTELWADERSGFPGGVYPDVDEDDWSDIGHYTQMIWSGTTHVGCATAMSGRDLYLVCRYAPVGNVIGEYVIGPEEPLPPAGSPQLAVSALLLAAD